MEDRCIEIVQVDSNIRVIIPDKTPLSRILKLLQESYSEEKLQSMMDNDQVLCCYIRTDKAIMEMIKSSLRSGVPVDKLL